MMKHCLHVNLVPDFLHFHAERSYISVFLIFHAILIRDSNSDLTCVDGQPIEAHVYVRTSLLLDYTSSKLDLKLKSANDL